MKLKYSKDFTVFVLFFAFAAISRLVSPLENFNPILALCLSAGLFIQNKKLALVLPFSIMLITDSALGFHSTMFFVYFSFFVAWFLGTKLSSESSLPKWGLTVLASSIFFFIFTNFGVWFVGGLYPKTIQGLVDCYLMAVPFFRNSLLSDILYSTAFYGLAFLVPKLEWSLATKKKI